MTQQERGIVELTYAQMALYFTNWMTGIYVNGYVPTSLLNGPTALFTSPAVLVHVCAAVLTFSLGIALFTLEWAYGQRRPALYALMALIAIAVTEVGGLSFALGLGDGDLDSMSMAVGFMTAVFLTFFSSMRLSSDPHKGGSASEARSDNPRARVGARSVLNIIYWELALFYLVFVSGMFVNIWVAGDFFSVPPAIAREALGRVASSSPIMVHAALGILLLGAGVASTASLWFRRFRRWVLASAASTALIGYSTLVGVLNIAGVPGIGISLPGAPGGYLALLAVSMASAAGFMASLLVSMLLAMEMRKAVGGHSSGALRT